MPYSIDQSSHREAQSQGERKQTSLSKERSVKEFVAVFDPQHVGCINVGCVEVDQQRGYEGERHALVFAS